MLKKLKSILNSYSDIELEDMDLWVNSNVIISYILINKNSINLLSEDIEIKLDGLIEQDGNSI